MLIAPFAPARLRRSITLFLVAVATGLGLFLIIFPSPDVSQELHLLKRATELSMRVDRAETANARRRQDLHELFAQFAGLLNAALGRDEEARTRSERYLTGGGRSPPPEAAAMLAGNANWTYDMSLPGVADFLPHTVGRPRALTPAFKLSKTPADQLESSVSIVLGIPTVKRDHQSYLSVTLESVLDNLSEEDWSDCLVIVFVAETDVDYVRTTAAEVEKEFPRAVEAGLLEVIGPPAEFYPDWSTLQPTLGDDLERVQWRSKQNLDYAFLMMYAQRRGVFYVQLEDDILTKPGFVATMRDFALERSLSKEPWFVIDYCQLGFIGKLFRSSDLPTLVQFFLMFYNDKPVDWLLDDLLRTKMCKLDHDDKRCKSEKTKLWVRYKPSLFQHIGTHSSLRGKVQRLKDKQFGRVEMFRAHTDNPPARVESPIKHYKAYSLSRAYVGETFFWGLAPQSGDEVVFKFTPPVELSGFKFVSGNAEHPLDKFVDTDVVIMLENGGKNVPENLNRSSDGSVTVGSFDSKGLAEGVIDPSWGKVSQLKLIIQAAGQNWVIISEMHLQTSS